MEHRLVAAEYVEKVHESGLYELTDDPCRVLRTLGGIGVAVVGFVLTFVAVAVVEAFLPIADAWSFVVLPVGLVASIVAGVGTYLLLGRVTGGDESGETDDEETLDRTTDPFLEEETEESTGE